MAVCKCSVNKIFFDCWFIISRKRTSVIIINTKIMPDLKNQILMNKTCDATACLPFFLT